ncbi:uncharacterized protein LOC144126312 [Amblyomma americanum]
MDLLKPPEPLQLSGNLSQNWKRFKQELELFIKATTPKDDPRSGAAKAALLLSVAGDEALDVFNTFTFGEQEDKEDYDTLVRKFEAYCAEVSNEVHERYVFRSRKQEDGEPFERFIRDLKKQAAQCNFEGLHDSMIRDQIVFGTNNSKLREKMLRERGLTLLKAQEMCRVAESVAQRNQVWARPGDSIDAVSRSRASCHRCVDRQETSAYVPGKHLVLADMLSRSTTPGGVDNASATEDVEVHALQLLNGMVTVTTQQKLAKETARDCYLQTVVSNLAEKPIQAHRRPPPASTSERLTFLVSLDHRLSYWSIAHATCQLQFMTKDSSVAFR